MEQPTTITELINQWSQLLTELTDENNEQTAYDMVGALGGNDTLWDEWYASGKEPNVTKVFDEVADLELPNGHAIDDDADRKAHWEQVKACVAELSEKYK